MNEPKVEYRVETLSFQNVPTGDGFKYKSISVPDQLKELLPGLGAEGWQLVSTIGGLAEATFVFIRLPSPILMVTSGAEPLTFPSLDSAAECIGDAGPVLSDDHEEQP